MLKLKLKSQTIGRLSCYFKLSCSVANSISKMPVKKTWLSEIWLGGRGNRNFSSSFFCFLHNGHWQWSRKKQTIRSEQHQHLSSRQCQPPASPSSTAETRSPAPLSVRVVASSLSLSDMSCLFTFRARQPKPGCQLGTEGSRLENGQALTLREVKVVPTSWVKYVNPTKQVKFSLWTSACKTRRRSGECLTMLALLTRRRYCHTRI